MPKRARRSSAGRNGRRRSGVTRVVAVDWSGRRAGEARAIWTAEVVDGAMVDLRDGRTRAQVIDHLVDLALSGEPLVVGLDFSFSVPAWFARKHGCADVGSRSSSSLNPSIVNQLVTFTASVGAIAGTRPKSFFQIGGAGAVGTGSLRGMPHLTTLRAAGFAIWPFDPPSRATVVEMWPRLCTGPVVKSRRAARVAHLAVHHPTVAAAAAATEDAFDAAVSAMVMAGDVEAFRQLPPVSTSVERIEGRIWLPRRYTSNVPPVRQ